MREVQKMTKDNGELLNGFRDWAIDHWKNFGAWPCEFEHGGRVFDYSWCWKQLETNNFYGYGVE